MAARLEVPRAGVLPVTVTAPARRAGLAWPRPPAAHLWQAEWRMHLRIGPWLNGLAGI